MKILYNLGVKITELGIGERLKIILPGFIFDILGFLYTYFIFFFGGYWKLLAKNKQLKGLGKGKRAFLLATGPSIKKEDLKVLANEDCFSVSNFFLHEDINVINPKFHFFIQYHKPLILDNYIEWLKQCDKTLPKQTKIFLGHMSKPHVEKYKLFSNREIFYLFTSPFTDKYNSNIEYPIIVPWTGPQMIIPVLIYMGYKKIYLLGCDCNTMKDYGGDRSDFYERKKDIRKNSTDKNSWQGNIIEFSGYIHGMFKGYGLLKKVAEKNGVEIINLSKESRLDIFEKKELSEIIKNDL